MIAFLVTLAISLAEMIAVITKTMTTAMAMFLAESTVNASMAPRYVGRYRAARHRLSKAPPSLVA